MFHCGAQTLATPTFHLGGKVHVMRTFDPVGALKAIEADKLSLLVCLPIMYRAMLDNDYIKNADLSSVKKCVYAMAPMDKRTLKESMEVFGADFLLGTGQTECFPSTNTFKPEWQLKKDGNYWGESALTVDTAVMDDDGNILPANQVGEIVWRGPNVMSGYLKNPEATAQSRKFGWHHSEDLGFFDEDRLLVFVDRKKDMIKTGGENVPTLKVELAILEDPRVEEVAVVGLPHERWIEAVSAFIVKKKDVELTEADIIDLCKKSLGGFEVPKKIIFVDELPKTATGKIKKNIVRDKYNNIYEEALL